MDYKNNISSNIDINIYEGNVCIKCFSYQKNKSFVQNMTKLRAFMKEEKLPTIDNFKFVHHNRKINLQDNLDIFKEFLSKVPEEVNIYFPNRNIMYPVRIYIVPLTANVEMDYDYNNTNNIIEVKCNVIKYTFNTLLKDINKILSENSFTTITEFHYVQEDGDVAWMNEEISKKMFDDVAYSLISSEPGFIIVNSDMN